MVSSVLYRKPRPKESDGVFEVSAVLLLGLLALKLTQLVDVQQKIYIELQTARWHTQQRVKELERKIEREG